MFPYFPRGYAYQRGFLVVKAVRKIACIDKSFENARKTAVVFRYDKQELCRLYDHFLDGFKLRAALSIEVRRNERRGADPPG